MKLLANRILRIFKIKISNTRVTSKHRGIFSEYREFTMMPEDIYCENLSIIERHLSNVDGDVVECGVWRGGMIAGIAKMLGDNRKYFLFDSFEGLPPAQSYDGKAAQEWQNDKNSPFYFDNCKAEVQFAIDAMNSTRVNYYIEKGWFNDTMREFSKTKKIALLRLDGDWYDSILTSLVNLYPRVVQGGLIIVDDYFAWDGCSKAVHDFLSNIKSTSKIRNTELGVTYLIKGDAN